MSTQAHHLLQPLLLTPSLHLRNRIVMSSLTRNRCIDANKPTPKTATHYATRAKDGVGLIISEGIFIYLNGCDYEHTPVLYKEEHVAPWKMVTDAVHKEGGVIFAQLWHPGRSQNENMPMLRDANYPVLAPSAIPSESGSYHLLDGKPPHTRSPTAMTKTHIQEILKQYTTSASLAKAAGFDGIEVLAQGDFLVHNFLLSRSNNRSDEFGGSTKNRTRFPLTLLEALTSVFPASRIGIKISPSDNMGDTASPVSETTATYTRLIEECVAMNFGYICLSRRGVMEDGKSVERPEGMELDEGYDVLETFGGLVRGKKSGSETKLMVNYECGVEEAEGLLGEGKVDFVGFGRPFICNPVCVLSFFFIFFSSSLGGFVYVWERDCVFVSGREKDKGECGLIFFSPVRGEGTGFRIAC
ncbi:unnamed protein product [Periconia digitata]|uniref:NADH:flavin oxidoreductase/NADH oxidase N-terminal domain-containing protein n=1 Tax=Periconia digitata TaxID=1303443 RepID=A0A9W4UN20_9PLEO|nr:unnamed protein product [Periconia digitata]